MVGDRELSIILRIDVDNAYPREWWSLPFEFLRTKLNLFYDFKWFNYLDNLEKLLDYLDKSNIRANIYFRPSTLPSENLKKRIINEGHEVGLHAVKTQDYSSFLNELENIENKFKVKIAGFTKHGLKSKLSRKHDEEYDIRKYINFAKRCDLDYFLGNKRTNNIGLNLLEGIIYCESSFSLKENFQQFSLETFLSKSKKEDVVVICHPINVFRKKKIKRKLDFIVKNGNNFKTISEVI